MRKIALLLLLAGFELAAQSTLSPQLKQCAGDVNPKECSSEKWAEFETNLQATLEGSSGYSIADSLYVKFEVTEEGNVEVAERFALISKVTLLSVVEALKDKAIDLKPTLEDKYYEWAWVTKLSDDFSGYKPIEEVERYPEMEECSSFNSKGRRACSQYILYKVEEELLSEGINESARFQVYFKEGRAVAIEADDLPRSKTLADRIVLLANQMMVKMATESSRANSEQFYTYLDFSFSGDSLERFNLGMDKLKYLKGLKSPDPYLEEALGMSISTFGRQEEAGNAFLLERFAEIGLDKVTQIKIGSSIYQIDSLTNDVKKVDEETLAEIGFAVVESKPVFKGCEQYDDTKDEAIRCFQMQMVNHVNKNFNFPKYARKKGIQGRMYTSFVIEKDGTVQIVEIVRGVHQSLDLECIRVMSELPDMHSPAMQRGKPVRMSFTMPINAKLQ